MSSATSSSSDGSARPAGAEALHGGFEQPRDPLEVERSAEEAGDRDFVGGNQRGARPRPGQARLTGDPQRRETLLVGGPELQLAGGDQVRRGRRRWPGGSGT